MRTFLKFCSIVSIIVATLKIVMMNRLTPEIAVFIMVGAILILIGNKILYTITAAVVALVLFLKVYGGTPQVNISLVKSILTLAIMLLGLLFMLRAIFPKPRIRR